MSLLDPFVLGYEAPLLTIDDLLLPASLPLILVRSARLGVVLIDSRARVRGFFWTRTISCDDIVSVSTIPYVGPWWLSFESLQRLRLDLRAGLS